MLVLLEEIRTVLAISSVRVLQMLGNITPFMYDAVLQQYKNGQMDMMLQQTQKPNYGPNYWRRW